MLRALVVDDSRAIRSMLSRMLADLGFEVHTAAHGREGVERLAEVSDVQVALVDWNMPEMNGLEFVKAVRAEPAFGHVRLMMVTTETDPEQVCQALDAGADEYAMKPLTKLALAEKLGLMGIRRAGR